MTTNNAPFWVQQTMEPKRAFRFIVKLDGMPDGASYYATKASKPKVSVEGIEHKYLNHTFKFPGRAKWEDVNISLVDPATPDAIGNLHRILVNSGYIVPSNENELRTISKTKAVSSVGTVDGSAGGHIEIIQLDADGLSIEKWTLRNAWVSEITPSEVSYESEDLSTIDLVIKYDWAELRVADGNGEFHTLDRV